MSSFVVNYGLYSLKVQNSQVDLGFSQNYAARLREERRRVNPSQLKFAEISGIDNTLLSALENGKQKIRADHLEPLARAGVDILFVVTGLRGGKLLARDESAILELFRALTPSAQAGLLVLLGQLSRDKTDDDQRPAIHDHQDQYRHG